jgi:hypothetical protein
MSMTKKKTFDCVEFKRQAQARIRAEWEKRKGEFASYQEFLEATQSEWERAFWARVDAAAKK